MEERTRTLENQVKEGKVHHDSLDKLKRFGVFVKTYNMGHLLATRYKVTENFGIEKHIDRLDTIEVELKDTQSKLNKKESEETKDQEAIETLRKKIGDLRNDYKDSLKSFKLETGVQLYNRFMKGFVLNNDNAEEKEQIQNTQFLFNKLNF